VNEPLLRVALTALQAAGVTLGIYTRFRDDEIDGAGAAIMDSLRGKSDYLLF
jgi:hypothetical protein